MIAFNIKKAVYYEGWWFYDDNDEPVLPPVEWPKYIKVKTLKEKGIEISKPIVD